MIFYFTATGNSKFIAERIAAATGDQITNIADCVDSGHFSFDLTGDVSLGFVVPVYYYGTPMIVSEFLPKFAVTSKQGLYTYAVLNCGSTTGDAARYIRRHIRVDAVFGLKTVDNYVPMYKVESESVIDSQLNAAELEIDRMAGIIKDRKPGMFNSAAGPLPRLVSPLVYPLYAIGRNTKRFRVNENCTGCGLCADICPRKAIDCAEGKPVWKKPKCEACLACLHRCPASAIEYRKSAGRGQYVNPRVTL